MPQPCTICSHAKRSAIDAELTARFPQSLRAIGERYGVGKDALSRHSQNHLPTFGTLTNPNIQDEKEQPEEAEARQEAEDSTLRKPEIQAQKKPLEEAEARQIAKIAKHEKKPTLAELVGLAAQSAANLAVLIQKTKRGR
jgi:hypothetical protein